MWILRPLALLPNTPGYTFTGVRHDGTYCACHVVLDIAAGIHKIAGDATYSELKGWLPA